MLTIDLNCDMGEGFANDAAIMPFISSVNIACGYHAGDPDTMRRTVEYALQHKVAIGAHPSYPDRENFGRQDMMDDRLQASDISTLVAEQVLLLQEICAAFGARLHHVKPHGALYNRAAKDAAVAMAVCTGIAQIDNRLLLYGLSNSIMRKQAAILHIPFVNEVFADRTYQDDARLTPRSEPGALIATEAASLQQVLQMVTTGTVMSTGGNRIPIIAETVCVHGDGPHALAFAQNIHAMLLEHHIAIQAPEK